MSTGGVRAQQEGAPAELLSAADDPRWNDLLAATTWAFVVLGIVIRLARYAARHPLWCVGAFLAANFLDRSAADMLGPLEYHQVCPVGFLWLELAVVKLLGFSEYSLRLVPTAASVASVLLFRHLAARLLRGLPLLMAVAIFSVSYYPIRFGNEVKPYSTDLFVSLALLALAVQWWTSGNQRRWLVMVGLFIPVAMLVSLPAVFVGGAVVVAIGAESLRTRSRGALVAAGALGGITCASFAVLFLAVLAGQYEAEYHHGAMQTCWDEGFPPWRQPAQLPLWLVDAHTGWMFSYPNGGKNGGSTLTTLLFAVGMAALVRRRHWTLVALLTTPFALAMIAAALERYPYAGGVRVVMYLAPIICLAAGLGAGVALGWIRQSTHRRRAILAALAVLAVMGSATLAQAVTRPYKTIHDLNDRELARWLWAEKAIDAELVCIRSDLAQSLNALRWEWGHSAIYLCNQRIYSERHRRREAPNWEAIGTDHPLRCVLFSSRGYDHDPASLAAWLAEMEADWQRVDHERYDVNSGTEFHNTLEIYEFVPREGRGASVADRPNSRPVQ